jgi:phage terminase large subunit-like protein
MTQGLLGDVPQGAQDTATLDAQLDQIEPAWTDDTWHFGRNLLDVVHLAEEQRKWTSCERRFALWRGGNSIGKSFAAAYDIIHTARGTHPDRPVKRPPVLLLVVGYSWAQMDPLCEKLWQLLPKDEIDPKVRYVPMNGFQGFKIPNVPFISGPGAGSVIAFATYEQGASRIMGIQVDGAWLDEPPPSDVYGEIRPRLNAKKGTLRITFTPTPESPPLQYMRDLVKEWHETEGMGGLYEMQTSLTVEAVTPGSELAPYPRMTQADIDSAIAGYLPTEREMRAHGAWDPVRVGRWIERFTEENVRDEDPVAGARLIVGIDYGLLAGKTQAVLIAAKDMHTTQGRVWFMAETDLEGFTDADQDAQAILDMLAGVEIPDGRGGRRPMAWDDVDEWWGDRPTGEGRDVVGKSNARLRRYLAKRLGVALARLPYIQVPRKSRTSVREGSQLLNTLFGGRIAGPDGKPIPLGLVHPRCVKLQDALLSWDGDKRHKAKDVLDAARYAAEAAAHGGGGVMFRAYY